MQAGNAVLLERVKQGDKEAESRLVEENTGLVWSIVRKFSGRGHEMEDLFQIGSIGLLKAIKKFDTSYGVQFSTYAVPMIMGEIKRFLRDDGPIKVSRSLKEKSMKGASAQDRLRKLLGREPTIHEISKECGLEVEELVEAFEAVTPPESIYISAYDRDGDKEINLLDRIASNDNEDAMINRILVQTILQELKVRERQIIVLRYFKGKTQSEIAEMVGVSQVQVSRIEKGVIEKLKKKYAGK